MQMSSTEVQSILREYELHYGAWNSGGATHGLLMSRPSFVIYTSRAPLSSTPSPSSGRVRERKRERRTKKSESVRLGRSCETQALVFEVAGPLLRRINKSTGYGNACGEKEEKRERKGSELQRRGVQQFEPLTDRRRGEEDDHHDVGVLGPQERAVGGGVLSQTRQAPPFTNHNALHHQNTN
ncbi:hypothetical protein DPX16_9959 [Anabarilius grahami]|uniref:Uncharacterized protein n=1 Tax=Anabarilius grahami TaxID=495550 RepID=A0A3N0XWL5_ANAGA|nr:hypothetical protein DPX16_9959 [Anabarilius grahami]